VIRQSKYWDDFSRRIGETIQAIQDDRLPPVRRVAVFITERCNLQCTYCKQPKSTKVLPKDKFLGILDKYGNEAIIHITGGEPSCVPWLYDTIREVGGRYRIHLNTNAYIAPPATHVKRLKISLDSLYPAYWDKLVGKPGAWAQVVENIRQACLSTVVSITYTLNRENYTKTAEFAAWAQDKFPGLYAIFFSIYKGTDPRFAMTPNDADRFFSEVYPKLETVLADESRELIHETIDEKFRLLEKMRFPENKVAPCYISMSERVISPLGEEFGCSHLYRDGIHMYPGGMAPECLSGCNRRLIMFNQIVAQNLSDSQEV